MGTFWGMFSSGDISQYTVTFLPQGAGYTCPVCKGPLTVGSWSTMDFGQDHCKTCKLLWANMFDGEPQISSTDSTAEEDKSTDEENQSAEK